MLTEISCICIFSYSASQRVATDTNDDPLSVPLYKMNFIDKICGHPYVAQYFLPGTESNNQCLSELMKLKMVLQLYPINPVNLERIVQHFDCEEEYNYNALD